MAEFTFVTTWRITAPLPQVCDTISKSMDWPQWWRNVEKVEELEEGDTIGIGRRLRFTWKSRLFYRLTFDVCVTHIESLKFLQGQASGDLEGTGRWYFTYDSPETIVRYEWSVRSTRRWINLLSPIARPIFKWNHDQVMRQGAEGLARYLNAPSVGTSN